MTGPNLLLTADRTLGSTVMSPAAFGVISCDANDLRVLYILNPEGVNLDRVEGRNPQMAAALCLGHITPRKWMRRLEINK